MRLFRGFSYKRKSPKFSQKTFQKAIDKSIRLCYNIVVVKNDIHQWGYSSVGRALEWHSRGQGFDSPYLHQQKGLQKQSLFCCVVIRGREALCKMPESKKSPIFSERSERSASCPAHPKQCRGWGVGSDSPPRLARISPPEQANPNCFVTTELFGFVFYFDYPY